MADFHAHGPKVSEKVALDSGSCTVDGYADDSFGVHIHGPILNERTRSSFVRLRPTNSGDLERPVFFFDLDNTLYSRHTGVGEQMADRIRQFFADYLGLPPEESLRLGEKFYMDYGLAVKGLVRHFSIDTAHYDAFVDGRLDLSVLSPFESLVLSRRWILSQSTTKSDEIAPRTSTTIMSFQTGVNTALEPSTTLNSNLDLKGSAEKNSMPCSQMSLNYAPIQEFDFQNHANEQIIEGFHVQLNQTKEPNVEGTNLQSVGTEESKRDDNKIIGDITKVDENRMKEMSDTNNGPSCTNKTSGTNLNKPVRVENHLKSFINKMKVRPWVFTNAGQSHAMRVLERLELLECFEGIVYCDYSEADFPSKPEVLSYERAMEAAGVSGRPDLCYFVDDSAENVRIAREVIGWTAFLLEEAGFQDDSLDYDYISSNFQSIFPDQIDRISPIHSNKLKASGQCSPYIIPSSSNASEMNREVHHHILFPRTIKTLDEIATAFPNLF